MKNLHFSTVKHCFFSNSMILIDVLSGNLLPLPYVYIYIIHGGQSCMAIWFSKHLVSSLAIDSVTCACSACDRRWFSLIWSSMSCIFWRTKHAETSEITWNLWFLTVFDLPFLGELFGFKITTATLSFFANPRNAADARRWLLPSQPYRCPKRGFGFVWKYAAQQSHGVKTPFCQDIAAINWGIKAWYSLVKSEFWWLL